MEDQQGIPVLEISTFGGLQLECEGKPVSGLASRKAEALLVFLAVTGRAQRREILADLFWDDRTQAQAASNLRTILSSLRKYLGPYISIDRYTVALNPMGNYWIDAAELESLVADALDRGDPVSPLQASQLEMALGLYQGDFLDGFHLRDSQGFDEWFIVERERLRDLVISALQELVRFHVQGNNFRSAIPYLEHMLQLNPLLETAHQQLMKMLTFSGQRGSALDQFDKCCGLLEEELAVSPSSETWQLYEQIKKGELVPPDATATHNLPSQTIPFVGRESEFADLEKLLSEPGTRLVTIVGIGGIGKTRLALEVAKSQLKIFSDGVFLVSLGSLASGEAILPAIAEAVTLSFYEGHTHKKQLTDYLSGKRILLILDNFEHLLDGASLVAEILKEAPKVKILATSRVVLNIQGEHQFYLGGLSIPENESTDILETYSAIQLFFDAARRVRPDFRITEDSRQHVVTVCKLVDGMPLGIILSATWVKILSPAEIAVEISRSLDFLESDGKDVLARQRSIRAVIDHSWNLISEREQEVLTGLSVFRGGFTRDAAQYVSGASLRELMSLVNKSLLYCSPSMRYGIHELTRQYLIDKLSASSIIEKEMRTRHCQFYVQELRQWEIYSKSPYQVSAMEKVQEDIANVRQAWEWAVEHQFVEQMEKGLFGLCNYYEWQALFEEGIEICQDAFECLMRSKSNNALRLASQTLTWQSIFHSHLAQNEHSVQLVLQGIDILDEMVNETEVFLPERAFTLTWMGNIGQGIKEIQAKGDPLEMLDEAILIYRKLNKNPQLAYALFRSGFLLRENLKYDQAVEVLEESLSISRKIGDNKSTGETLAELSIVNRIRGDLERSEKLALESVERLKVLPNTYFLADVLRNLGWNRFWIGKFGESLSVFEEALAIFKNLGVNHEIPYVNADMAPVVAHLGNYNQVRPMIEPVLETEKAKRTWYFYFSLFTMGMLLAVDGEYIEAEQLLKESIRLTEEIDSPMTLGIPLSLLGIVYVRSGNYPKGKECIVNALRRGLEIGTFYTLVHIFPAAASYLASQGEHMLAVEIYELAKQYPYVANSRWFEDILGNYMTEIVDKLPREVAQAAKERGKTRDPGSTIGELLERFEKEVGESVP